MTANEIINAIPELKFTELQAYLRNTGWERIDTGKPLIALFQKEKGNHFYETVLPLNKDFADYSYRIFDVLEAIAAAENREIDQVLTDLTLPPGDVVRFRVMNRDTIGGTISFLEGFGLLESAKKALFATACDILQPEKYHKRLGLKGAQQFIEECRLGQTEKRSFSASVICPFVNYSPDEKALPLSIFSKESDFINSFTRKVTTRMMSALEIIKTNIDRGEENKIVDMEGPEMISGNFLESVLELACSKENSEIEINTSWSVFAERQAMPNSTIKFSNDYIPVFQSLIEQIKPKDEAYNDVFIGRISQTKADPDPNSRKEGEIVLNYVSGDEEKVSKARIILNKEAYDQACEAHKSGATVRITGKLLTIGRSKIIENSKFEIIQ